MELSPRLATFLMFIINGAVVGIWIASIPSVKSGLDATGTEFGLALLAVPSGALVAQQVTGQLLVRVSSRRLLSLFALLLPWFLVPPLLATSLVLLAVSLFALAYFVTSMDISMNAHGVVLEDAGGRSIFSMLHGGWSVGGLAGALVVAAALALGIEPVVGAAISVVLMLLVAVVAGRHLGRGSVRTDGVRGFHRPSRAVLPIAGLLVLVVFVEAGLSDWGGVYLDTEAGASATISALAYAALSLGLLIGRLAGDAAKDRIGSIQLTRWGMVLAAVAIVAMVATGEPWPALLALVAAGVGIANAVPQLLGAAGRIRPPGPSLSAGFTALTVGLLLSPAVLGTTSDVVGLGTAYLLLVASSVAVAVLVVRVPAAETNARFARSMPVDRPG